MATSSTDTWSATRDEIIADALTNLGVLAPGKAATGDKRDFASRALNRLVKSLDPEAQFLWRMTSGTLSLIAGTSVYSFPADYFLIDGPMSFLATGGTDRQLITQMSRDDFMEISSRTQTGTPTHFFIQRTLILNGQENLGVTFWPVPDAAATVQYYGLLRAKDYSAGSDTSHFPTSWIRCLVYGLTMELAPAFGQFGAMDSFKALFDEEKAKLILAGGEKGPLTFVPWGL